MTMLQPIWQKFHADATPLGTTLASQPNWNLTRFHLLPRGREAALSRDEFKALLVRFNRITTEVLGDAQPFWLIVPDRAPPELMPRHAIDKKVRGRMRRLKSRYGLTPQWDYFSTSDNMPYRVEAAPYVWHPHAFDRLFIQIYNELLAGVVLMNAETGAVVAPYAAGVHVSQPTPDDLMALVGKFYGWLPVPGEGILRFNPAQATKTSFQVSKACAAAIQTSLGN